MREIYFSDALCRTLDELGSRCPKGEKDGGRFRSWSKEVFCSLYPSLVVGKNDYNGESDSCSEAVIAFYEGIRAYDPDVEKLSHYAKRALRQNHKVADAKEAFAQKTGGISSGGIRKYYAERKKLERSPANADPALLEQKLEALKASYLPNVERLVLESDDADDSTSPNEPGRSDDVEGRLIVQAVMLEIAARIIQIRERRAKERENGTKWRFFPLWYTEKLTNVVQSGLPLDSEAELLFAVECCYQDFFMERPCRSFASIRSCALRRENEIFPESTSSARLRWNAAHWLEAKVPIRYLRDELTCTDSTISRSRKSYEDELMDILEIKLKK